MKSTWLTARGGGIGHIGSRGANNHPAKGEEMNAPVTISVKEVLKKKA